MTFQEAFDFVLDTMRARDYRRARLETGKCVMCTADGVQCAVGMLVGAQPDWPQERSWEELKDKFKDLPVSYEVSREFFYELQACHDRNTSPERFELDMSSVARQFGLVYKEPV